MRKILLFLILVPSLPFALRADEIVAVNPGRGLVTIHSAEGTTATVVDASTIITIDGAPNTIANLQPGMPVKYTPSGPGVQQRLDASSPPPPPEMALRQKALQEELPGGSPTPAPQQGGTTVFGSPTAPTVTEVTGEVPAPPILQPGESGTDAQAGPTPPGLTGRLWNSRWSWPLPVNPEKLGWIRLRSDMTVRAGWHDWHDRGRWKVIDENTVVITVPTVNDIITLKLNTDDTEATDSDNHVYHRLNG